MNDGTAESRIRSSAARDAYTHQEEFPGQPILGDWDSEAWRANKLRLAQEIEDVGSERAWEIYRDQLHFVVNGFLAQDSEASKRP